MVTGNVAETWNFSPPNNPWSALLWELERSLVSCLAAGIVHDLNNALSTMQTNAFLLKDGGTEDQLELLGELDASLDEGIGLTRQLRSLVGKPLAGPATRTVAALIGDAEAFLAEAASQHRRSVVAPPGADQLWVEPLSSERVVTSLLVLLLAVLPARDAELGIGARVLGQNGQPVSSSREPGAQSWLTLSATHPVLQGPSQLEPRRQWLVEAPAARCAETLTRRLGGSLSLVVEGGASIEYRVALPLLSAEQVRVLLARAHKSKGGLDVAS
jgi:hypothetical protein